MTKRIIAALLALLLLSGVLVACKKPDGPDDNTQEKVTVEDAKYSADYLPDKTFNGYTIRNICLEGTCNLVFEADESKKANVAKYEAIERIKAKYDLNVEDSFQPDWQACSNVLEEYAGSGSDEADLNMLIHREGFSLGVQGYLYNYKDLPYVDVTQPWYVSYLNEAHTVEGYCFHYYTTACTDTYSGAMGTQFNRQIVADKGLEDPFALAESGNWTIDKYLELALAATEDLNQDGVFTDEDNVGVVNAGDMIYPTLWIGAGINEIERDEDGYPEYTAAGNEKLIDLLTKIIDASKSGSILDTTLYNNADQRGEELRIFTNGHSLFRMASMSSLSGLAEMTDDYGMIPAPKYDETQQNYLSRVCDAWTNMLPATLTHPEEVAVFLEAFAVESINNVVDAYYKQTLQDRYSDERTKYWLDVIRDSVTLDLGDTVWQANCRNKTLDICWQQSGDVASSLKGFEKLIRTVIKRDLEDASYN